MKLTDLVAQKQSKDPKYKGQTPDQVADQLYAQQARQLSDTRNKLRQAESRKSEPISIEISTAGDLQLSKTIYDRQLQQQTPIRKTIVKSEVLSDLAHVISPLLMATKAMYKSGGVLSAHALHEVDETGKTTKNVLKDEDGQTLYAADPISQFKAVCYVLEHNEQAQQALKTLKNVLTDMTPENLKQLKVTQPQTQSPKPIAPRGRGEEAGSKFAAMMALIQSASEEKTDESGPTFPGE